MARTAAQYCVLDPDWIRIQVGQLIRIKIGNPDQSRLKLSSKRNFKKLKKTFKTVRKQKNYFGITKKLGSGSECQESATAWIRIQ